MVKEVFVSNWDHLEINLGKCNMDVMTFQPSTGILTSSIFNPSFYFLHISK